MSGGCKSPKPTVHGDQSRGPAQRRAVLPRLHPQSTRTPLRYTPNAPAGDAGAPAETRRNKLASNSTPCSSQSSWTMLLNFLSLASATLACFGRPSSLRTCARTSRSVLKVGFVGFGTMMLLCVRRTCGSAEPAGGVAERA